jgi:hypothetical protein
MTGDRTLNGSRKWARIRKPARQRSRRHIRQNGGVCGRTGGAANRIAWDRNSHPSAHNHKRVRHSHKPVQQRRSHAPLEPRKSAREHIRKPDRNHSSRHNRRNHDVCETDTTTNRDDVRIRCHNKTDRHHNNPRPGRHRPVRIHNRYGCGTQTALHRLGC